MSWWYKICVLSMFHSAKPTQHKSPFFPSYHATKSFGNISSNLRKYASNVTSLSGLYPNSPIELITESWEKYYSWLDHFLFLRKFQVIMKIFFPLTRVHFNAFLSLLDVGSQIFSSLLDIGSHFFSFTVCVKFLTVLKIPESNF